MVEICREKGEHVERYMKYHMHCMLIREEAKDE